MPTKVASRASGKSAVAKASDDAVVDVPAYLMKPSTFLATRTLLKAILLATIGTYATYVSPWYLVWASAACTGTALCWIYAIAYDCSQRSFFKWRWVNHFIGVIGCLPLLRPFASLRVSKPEAVYKPEGIALRIRKAWSLSALKALYATNDWRRNVMPVIDVSSVIAFSVVFFPLLVWYTGMGGLLKYWGLPFTTMHLRMGSFGSMATHIPYLALFHPELKSLKSNESVKRAVASAMARVPSYNLVKAHRFIEETVEALRPAPATQFPLKNVLSGTVAPLNALSFGRTTKDTALWAYTVTILVVAATVWHKQSAATLLIPTLAYLAWASPVRQAVFSVLGLTPQGPPVNIPEQFNHGTPTVSLSNGNWKIHKFNVIYLGLMHVLFGVSVWYTFAHWSTANVVCFFVMYHISAMGITAGAHRLWAHKTYSASTTFQIILMLCNSMSNQGSILKWSRDHRLHHKHVDTDMDPHDSRRGFWWSHCGWLLIRKDKTVVESGKTVYMDDLLSNPVVMFQSRHYPWLAPFMCFGFPALCGHLFCGDALGGFLLSGIGKYVITLHATWLVNSAAHMWGYRPYVASIKPAENIFVAFMAAGEGWHNYHHAFPQDYSANEYGALQWNPTTLFLDISRYFGMIWDCKRGLKIPGTKDEDLPVFSWEEVRALAAQAGKLFVLEGFVYDVTSFADEHPGGPKILRPYYGKDATKAFRGSVHAHTAVADNMLKPWRVGRVVEQESS